MVRNIDRQFRSKANDQSASVASSSVPWCTKPGAVEQDVDRSGVRGGALDIGGGRGRPAPRCGWCRRPGRAVCRVDVGGDHPRSGGGEGQRGGAADALAGGGDERGLSRK